MAQIFEFHKKEGNDRSRGFTLVELAVVFVVASLLVTAVLIGKDLIRAAELQSVVTDIGSFKVAINNFEMQFGKKPGDLRNASEYWPDACIDDGLNLCNGNGDEKIFPSGSEGLRVWQHLNLADMLPGSYAGISDDFLDDLALLETNTDPGFQFSSLFIGSAFAIKEPGGSDEYTICHSDSTVTVSGSDLEIHLYHGDSMGSCDDSGGEGKYKVSMCHGGSTITVSTPAVIQAHLDHGDSTGACSDEVDDTDVAEEEEEEEEEVVEEDDIAPYSRFTIGFNVPPSKIDFGGFKVGRINGHNSFTFASEHYPLLTGSVLTPLEAWIIDNKIDDGEAGNGNVFASKGEDDSGCTGSDGYNFNNGNTSCRVHFLFD